MNQILRPNLIIRLETREEQIEYAHRINQELGPIVQDNVEQAWSVIKNTVNMAGKNSNKTINKKRNRWFDDQCEAELEKRNKLRLKMLTQRTKKTETSYLKQRKICKADI
ncbi:hypothetical protein Zmor_026987 [Zophobas morio]|uniref:Uncharacterized protein n=1 Tax=Zophobas morio TaxID=2755281 RepID=A0AA38HWV9_9CUCU|nr:hypothetical protein Zmor_026987 [Zophobas morio]